MAERSPVEFWRSNSRPGRSLLTNGAIVTLKANLDQVLRAAAEVAMTLDRVQGIIVGVRLYSVIEDRAHQLGLELSRRIPAQQMGTLAAVAAPLAKYA